MAIYMYVYETKDKENTAKNEKIIIPGISIFSHSQNVSKSFFLGHIRSSSMNCLVKVTFYVEMETIITGTESF